MKERYVSCARRNHVVSIQRRRLKILRSVLLNRSQNATLNLRRIHVLSSVDNRIRAWYFLSFLASLLHTSSTKDLRKKLLCPHERLSGRAEAIKIRKAKVDDYFTCLPLFSLLYHGNVGADFQQTFEAYIRNDDGVVLLAEDSDKVTGVLAGSYHLDIDWEGRTAKIDAIIVNGAYRRKGIGRELAKQFMAMTKRKNYKAVKSRINTKNVIAQKFHEALGFTKTDTCEYFLDFQEPQKQ